MTEPISEEELQDWLESIASDEAIAPQYGALPERWNEELKRRIAEIRRLQAIIREDASNYSSAVAAYKEECERLRAENNELGESLAQSHHDAGDCNRRIATEQEEAMKIIREAIGMSDLLEAQRLIALGKAVETMPCGSCLSHETGFDDNDQDIHFWVFMTLDEEFTVGQYSTPLEALQAMKEKDAETII